MEALFEWAKDSLVWRAVERFYSVCWGIGVFGAGAAYSLMLTVE
jgi:hypothetical protein